MSALPDQSYLSPILAGRAEEVSALQRGIQRAYAGAGQVILISGEAGIGKSRLIREARTIAQARGCTILQGNCFEPDRTLPFAPFADLLRHIALNRLAEVRHLLPQLLKLVPDMTAHPISRPRRWLSRSWRSGSWCTPGCHCWLGRLRCRNRVRRRG